MYRLKARFDDLLFGRDGNVKISFTVAPESKSAAKEIVDELNGDLAVQIGKYRDKRSLDANAFCWLLLQKLAEKLRSTKEDLYRNFIRDVGHFEIVPIRNDAVETWIRAWNSRGLGWSAEVLDKAKFDGYTRVINYFGSSVYNTEQMSILIDRVVDECKAQGIPTETPEEIARMKEAWGK